jgi:c-di-GMP-binding flagellar brake protein YcgR
LPVFHLDEEAYVEPTSACPGFHTQVVGAKPPHFLILCYPPAVSDVRPRKVRDLATIQCFQQPAVRFTAGILTIVPDPTPLLITEYPFVVETLERRRGERKKVFIRGEFFATRPNGKKDAKEGYILDISDSGCLVTGDFVHLMDCQVHLNFRVPWSDQLIKAVGRVVRCEVSGSGIRGGIEFVDMDPKAMDQLKGLVKSLQDDLLLFSLPGSIGDTSDGK